MANDVRSDAAHWDEAYGHGDTTRSWYQASAALSLRMFASAGVTAADSVIDVGGGASTLVDALLEQGYGDVTVLDISTAGIRAAQSRLGESANLVRWVTADLLDWRPDRTFGVWHDRAVLHFMTSDDARDRYLGVLAKATSVGSVAVFATFAPDGPEQCSGLAVRRYSADDLIALLGAHWRPTAIDREEHRTPGGAVQPFTWAAFRRIA